MATDENLSWQAHANCLGVNPAPCSSPVKAKSLNPPKPVCRGCVVRDEFLEHALVNAEHFGVWGGLSEHERRPIRVERNRQLRTGGAS